jgi:MscS family membrane protein
MVFEEFLSIVNLNEYTRALAIFIGLFIVLRIILFVVQRISLMIASRTKSKIDDNMIKGSGGALTFIALLLSLYFALKQITFPQLVEPIVYNLLYSFLAISIGYLVFIVIDVGLLSLWKVMAKRTKSNIDDALGGLAHEVLRIAIILILGIMILSIWGVEVGPLLAGLGIAGLAVALALQPTLSNIFSGISLILDQTYNIGDMIKIDDVMGEIYSIGLRTTRIKSFDNEMFIIPNSKVAEAKIQNFLQPDPTIRMNVEFGVGYGADPEYIKKIAIEEVEKIKFIDKEQEIRVLFLSMGDSALNFKIMFWVDHIDKRWPAHQEAITRIYRRLYKEGIEIPFPQRTVWLRDEGKAKSQSPLDKKFKTVHGKYYPAFGHEYKEPEKEESKKEEKKKSKWSIFSKK